MKRSLFFYILVFILLSCSKDADLIIAIPNKPLPSEIFIDGVLYSKFVSSEEFEWKATTSMDSVAIFLSDCTFVLKEYYTSYGIGEVKGEGKKTYTITTRNSISDLDHKKRSNVQGLNTGYLLNPKKAEFTYFNYCDFTINGVDMKGKEYFVVMDDGK